MEDTPDRVELTDAEFRVLQNGYAEINKMVEKSNLKFDAIIELRGLPEGWSHKPGDKFINRVKPKGGS